MARRTRATETETEAAGPAEATAAATAEAGPAEPTAEALAARVATLLAGASTYAIDVWEVRDRIARRESRLAAIAAAARDLGCSPSDGRAEHLALVRTEIACSRAAGATPTQILRGLRSLAMGRLADGWLPDVTARLEIADAELVAEVERDGGDALRRRLRAQSLAEASAAKARTAARRLGEQIAALVAVARNRDASLTRRWDAVADLRALDAQLAGEVSAEVEADETHLREIRRLAQEREVERRRAELDAERAAAEAEAAEAERLGIEAIERDPSVARYAEERPGSRWD